MAVLPPINQNKTFIMAKPKNKIELPDGIVSGFQSRIAERDAAVAEAQEAYQAAQQKEEAARAQFSRLGNYFEAACDIFSVAKDEYEYVPQAGDTGGYLRRLSDEDLQRLRQAQEEATQQNDSEAEVEAEGAEDVREDKDAEA
jgi:hypothetical protein